ncbi:MAG: adenosine kinase [Bacteroidales bacterium]
MMKIIGIGNALVDILAQMKDEKLLEQFKLPKGSMTLVDREMSNLINEETSGLKKTQASGGSAANTIHGLANLGIETAYIGKIGRDELGQFFLQDMEKSGISPILYQSVNDTGRVMALVSPDSERTMATYLGAAIELMEDDLSSGIFDGYNYLYIEGYLINNLALVKKSIQLGKEEGLRVCIDLASYNIVEQYKDALLNEVLPETDIIFANEEEAKALTGLEPKEALEKISELCDIAIAKTGSKGSLIKRGNEMVEVPAHKVESIDTTGAGDIYAAGFLYGQVMSMSLEQSARIGTLLASRVIGIMGPKLDEKAWVELKREIGMMEKKVQ